MSAVVAESEFAGARRVASGLRKRVLIPLGLSLLVLVAMVVAMTVVGWQEHQEEQVEEIESVLGQALKDRTDQGVMVMRSLTEMAMKDPALRAAFSARDRAALVELTKPLLDKARSRHGITHLYFILPDRTVLERGHDPGRAGDRVDRHTLLEAERTGEPASGVEASHPDTFALRLVQPWKVGTELIGYLEMAIGMENLVTEVQHAIGTHAEQRADLLLVLNKSLFDATQWTAAQSRRAKPVPWDEFPDVVVRGRTLAEIPPGLRAHLAEGKEQRDHGAATHQVSSGGATSHLVETAVLDARGKQVGELIAVKDASVETRAWQLGILGVLLVFGAIGSGLVVFFHALLGRVERDIAERAAHLQEERQRNAELELRSRMVDELAAAKRTAEEALAQNEETTARLRQARNELTDAARQAGRAEIATNVLHNVGNVLNSVNISAGAIGGTLRKSRLPGLAKAVQMMQEHGADIGPFLAEDPKGRMLPGYLGAVADALRQEQEAVQEELRRLTRSIEHITEIVSTQQSHAKARNVVEPVQPSELAEDALRLQGDSLTRHQVTVIREFEPVPVVPLDRGRVLQILVNLISNAKAAMSGLAHGAQRLTLRVEMDGPQRLRFTVRDEGEGIAPENLTRIFVHGFTTRKTGHGFGLHSSALAASQLGGSLTAHSDGPGRGATFVLELPIEQPAAA